MKLSEEQVLFAINQVERWLLIKEDNNKGTFPPDPSHSSLLHWLFSGNEPLPKPPPVLWSRPCHRLANGEEIQLDESPRDITIGEKQHVVIAQNSNWVWHDKEKGLLLHEPSGEIYQITVDNKLSKKS